MKDSWIIRMGKGRKRSRSQVSPTLVVVVGSDPLDPPESQEESTPAPKRQVLSSGQGEGWRCEVCAVRFNSAAQWEGHLKGKKHHHRALTAAPPPSSPPSPSSDTEDYNVFRQHAPRIKKKKKRTRDRDRKDDPDDPSDQDASTASSTRTSSQEESQKASSASTISTGSKSARLEGCPWLSAFCRIRHVCDQQTTLVGASASGRGVGWKEQCPECGKDRREEKLVVSLTQCPIRQVTFLPKAKFHAHSSKGIGFLQWFVLCLDLRVAGSVMRSVRWCQSILKVRPSPFPPHPLPLCPSPL